MKARPSGLRVAIDVRALQQGYKAHRERGIGRHAQGLIRAIRALRPDGPIGFFSAPGEPADLDGCPLPVVTLSPPGWIDALAGGRQTAFRLLGLASALRGVGAEVVHFLSHTDAPARHPGGMRVIVTAHDLIPILFRREYADRNLVRNLRSRFGTMINSRALASADRVIAVSETTRQDLVRVLGIDPKKIVVIPNGVRDPGIPGEAAVRRFISRLEVSRPYLLHVGGIDRRKNVEILPALLRRVRRAGLDFDLVFAGRIEREPEFPALRAAVREAGVEEHVRFAGYVPDEEIAALYASAWALVEPSLYEGFGLPVLEAMSAGTPVISSNRGALPEVAGDAALLGDPEVETMAEAVGRLARENGLRQRLVERGKARARSFDWLRSAEATIRVYEEALGGPL